MAVEQSPNEFLTAFEVSHRYFEIDDGNTCPVLSIEDAG